MLEITVPIYPIDKGKLPDLLKANHIHVNDYAVSFMAHPDFDMQMPPAKIQLVICSLSELGLQNGAVLENVITKAEEQGLRICPMTTGLYLRLFYLHQPMSKSNILTGTNRSPDGAIVVLSRFPEKDDEFPKGLYLRNVDGTLWLRGYVCDQTHIWSADDAFAFQKDA